MKKLLKNIIVFIDDYFIYIFMGFLFILFLQNVFIYNQTKEISRLITDFKGEISEYRSDIAEYRSDTACDYSRVLLLSKIFGE